MCVSAFAGRVALSLWSGFVAVHLYIVEDVDVLVVVVGCVLRGGVRNHVAVDGVHRCVVGGLLLSLVSLVLWIEDGVGCLEVSKFLRGLKECNAGRGRAAPIGGAWVEVGAHGVIFWDRYAVTTHVGCQEGLPVVSSSGGRDGSDLAWVWCSSWMVDAV